MEMTKKSGISAAVLKNIALVTMTIDHVTAYLLKDYLNSIGIVNLYLSSWYWLGRVIGRIAFVLYAFMIAEGALKTRSKVKYAARLLILAVISIIPHSYVGARKLFDPSDLNIYFLLFLGLVTIYAWEWLKEHIVQKALSVGARLILLAASCAISELCHIEYGLMGILLILVFYIYRYDIPRMLFAGFVVMSAGYMLHTLVYSPGGPIQWIIRHSASLIPDLLKADRIQIFGLLAFPLLYFYNGEKGKQLPKWFYYFYYPVHLGVIAMILYL